MLGVGLSLSVVAQMVQGVQVERVDRMQKTMVVNRGEGEGMVQGMVAFFLVAPSPLASDWKLLGQARALKASRGKSLWWFGPEVDVRPLQGGTSLAMVSELEALRGWKVPEVMRHLQVRFRADREQRAQLDFAGKPSQKVLGAGDYHQVNIAPIEGSQGASSQVKRVLDLGEWTERGQQPWAGFDQVLGVKPLLAGPQTRNLLQGMRQAQVRQRVELVLRGNRPLAPRGVGAFSEDIGPRDSSAGIDALQFWAGVARGAKP